ncbi:MAG: pyruvate, water dikinase regulatory protein [Symbiobacteriia bacterium]
MLFAVSDSTGETVERLVQAVLSQFNAREMRIEARGMVDSCEAVDHLLAEAASRTSVIAYTIVSTELRQFLAERAEAAGVPAVDVLGPLMDSIAGTLKEEPKMQPGLVHRLDADYFKRVEAVEFAVKYDDGRDPRGLEKAEVVLVGLSRSSKTPVSMYLAHRRLRVANVPLVPEVAPPAELFRLPPGKVIGLSLGLEKLHDIRTARLKTIGLKSDANYASFERILTEIEYAESVFKKLGCPVIDVTNQAVEETAVKVLETINRGTRYGDG